MSDVPASAFWALAAACLLRGTTGSAFCGGLAASLAILTRPNLLLVGVWMGAWAIWREFRTPPARPARVAAFAAGALPGCVAVAALNYALRGSPVASGYGELGAIFSLDYIPINASRYVRWIVQTQTPIWFIGLAALALPLTRLWGTTDARRGCWLLFGMAAIVVASYVAYVPFDAWWFLRFLLPAWPAFAVGTAALLFPAAARASRGWRAAAGVATLAFGLYGAVTAVRLGEFSPGEGERRYASVAEAVARHTPPDAVILAIQYSAGVDYYGGRVTLRLDELDPAWLDRAIAWLEAQGRPPYLLLEEQELAEFRQRFAGQHAVRPMSPAMAYRPYRTAGSFYLFDPSRPYSATVVPLATPNFDRCPGRRTKP